MRVYETNIKSNSTTNKLTMKKFLENSDSANIIDHILTHYPVLEIACLLNGIVWGIILGNCL
jgi:hypothetical protein